MLRRLLLLTFPSLLAAVLFVAAALAPPTPAAAQVRPTADAANVIVVTAEGVVLPYPTFDPRVTYIAPTATVPGFAPYQGNPVIGVGDSVRTTVGGLRLRVGPSTGFNSQIITELRLAEDMTVLGISADRQWYFVQVDGQPLRGWVFGAYVEKVDGSFQPFADSLPEQNGTGFFAVTSVKVNVRSTPTIFSDRVGIFGPGTQLEIIGRKSTNNWWKVRANGVVGWVAFEYIYIQDQDAYRSVPVLTE